MTNTFSQTQETPVKRPGYFSSAGIISKINQTEEIIQKKFRGFPRIGNIIDDIMDQYEYFDFDLLRRAPEMPENPSEYQKEIINELLQIKNKLTSDAIFRLENVFINFILKNSDKGLKLSNNEVDRLSIYKDVIIDYFGDLIDFQVNSTLNKYCISKLKYKLTEFSLGNTIGKIKTRINKLFN